MSNRMSPDAVPAHLSEFYPIVNNLENAVAAEEEEAAAAAAAARTSGTSKHVQGSAVSPLKLDAGGYRRASSLHSNVSSIRDLDTLVTRRDMKLMKEVLTEIQRGSLRYMDSLRETSKRSSELASAFEELARLKGCSDDTAEKILSASGLFHLMANHELILSSSVDNVLNVRVGGEATAFGEMSALLERRFKEANREQTLKLRMQEQLNSKLSKRKTKNLLTYRESLHNLQLQLDEIESLRHDFFQDSYNLVETTCTEVMNNVATLTRAHVEISENIARKGWSGGGLDDLLVCSQDPFSKDGDEDDAEIDDEAEEEEEDASGSNNDNVTDENMLRPPLSAETYVDRRSNTGGPDTVRSDGREESIGERASPEAADEADINDQSFSLPVPTPPSREQDDDDGGSDSDIAMDQSSV
ncbi:Ivy1p KNAG_0A04280 [Huiozyma naganishii CBS 8797]|uniref:Uncharacterized protein n=1 Tax=Huiozyma naganishii (strain ATCC MYA-139 / BCRC 22969 / CBS 8797 / KCTC 17520 / NBRC 10181 / NCYC 3082 / Yp74L-3) TaxID=1071383 RepID=J7QZZ0_HUIN7|nr:hypothetical protein KNAG_0A04280 [Kazachstania naganishii CBS 8797]CCK68105.1 hypothetical protein KNAG_0A04280 [Kazachstania naganishii CBS 8797]